MSDVARRRIAALLLAVVAGVAALAITDTGPFDDPPTREQEVQTTVERFFAAAAAGDSQVFCDLLTTDARQALRVNTAQQLEIDVLPKCEQILDRLSAAFAGSTVQVKYVSVSGNRARVETRYRSQERGAEPRTVLLLEEDGVWHISDAGG